MFDCRTKDGYHVQVWDLSYDHNTVFLFLLDYRTRQLTILALIQNPCREIPDFHFELEKGKTK